MVRSGGELFNQLVGLHDDKAVGLDLLHEGLGGADHGDGAALNRAGDESPAFVEVGDGGSACLQCGFVDQVEFVGVVGGLLGGGCG